MEFQPSELGKLLMGLGAVVFLLGAFFAFKDSLPFLRFFGQMPGDIVIKREGFQLYFPLTTSILLSVLITFFVWLFRR